VSDGAIETIRLTGELEISRRREMREAFTPREDARAFLVDLSEVTYADSTALTELLRFCIAAQRDGLPLAIVIRTRQFSRLVQYAGLAGAFPIFEELDEALAHLSRGVNP
jgi:anti-anti-sigma factor